MTGGTVTLTCSLTLPRGVTDTPDFQWEGPGGVTLTPAASMTSGQTVSSDLPLNEITTYQAGQYTCTATLRGSINTSTTITVESEFKSVVMGITDATCSAVPTPTPFIRMSGSFVAGTISNLTCNYTLSQSVDTAVSASAVWTVNGTAVATSEDGGHNIISSDGLSLVFSPLTTSDTGRYTCTLTLTASPQTPHVTVQGPAMQSPEKIISVQSEAYHFTSLVILYDLSVCLSACC